MSGVDVQAIYNRLAAAPRYHPLSANTFADWSMEAGDIVTVNRDGVGYSSPVGSMTMRWNGQQQIEISSEGSRERDPISRVSAREYAKGGGGASGIRAGQGLYNANQELYWEMFDESGELHATISATAQYLTSDYTNKIDQTASEFRQTAGQISASVSSLDTRLTSRIDIVDSSASMSVGRIKYSSTAHYANKANFPTTGTAGVLYYADDTGKAYLYMPGTHSYELASVDEYGNANYIKAGEIAISINESGNTTAKLDADRVLAGKGALTVDDLDLPDWMDTTTGLIATKATIVSLNALTARVGTLETDYLKTARLDSEISNLSGVTVKVLEANSVTIKSGGYLTSNGIINAYGGIQDSGGHVYNVYDASVSGNTLTIKKIDGTTINFSKATSLSGTWSGGTFTATASPQNVSRTTAIFDATSQDISWSGNTATIAVYANIDGGETRIDTGKRLRVDASTRYTAGYNMGVTEYRPDSISISGQNVTVLNAAGDTVGGPYSASSIYDNGYAAGFDAVHTLSIDKGDQTSVTTHAMGYDETLLIYPGMTLSTGGKRWGSRVTITAPSDRYQEGYDDGAASASYSNSARLTYTGSETVGALTRYTFYSYDLITSSNRIVHW